MLSSANIIHEEDFLNINLGQALRCGGVCVYVCLRVCVCTGMYICVSMCVWMHAYISLYLCVYLYKVKFCPYHITITSWENWCFHFLKVCSFSVAEMRFQPCSLALQPTVIITSFPPSSHLFFHFLFSPSEVEYAHWEYSPGSCSDYRCQVKG